RKVPVDVPVNVCGNTVDAAGLLNPAVGNECGNESPGTSTPPPVDTPNEPPVDTPHEPPVQPPHEPPAQPPNEPPTHHKPPHHHKPDCPPDHHKPPTHHKPPHHHKPDCPPDHHEPPTHNWPHKPPVHHEPQGHHQHHQHHQPPQLAHTGADAKTGLAGGASAAMVLGGALLMRRARASKG
ncbi:chaplin, partial [Streptomyces sp. NPDC015032]|uniref:chaplin n=1 Tax=Streptomyces sp. NPDC015032 TaxID=3364937 RepID=UPI0036FB9E04